MFWNETVLLLMLGLLVVPGLSKPSKKDAHIIEDILPGEDEADRKDKEKQREEQRQKWRNKAKEMDVKFSPDPQEGNWPRNEDPLFGCPEELTMQFNHVIDNFELELDLNTDLLLSPPTVRADNGKEVSNSESKPLVCYYGDPANGADFQIERKGIKVDIKGAFNAPDGRWILMSSGKKKYKVYKTSQVGITLDLLAERKKKRKAKKREKRSLDQYTLSVTVLVDNEAFKEYGNNTSAVQNHIYTMFNAVNNNYQGINHNVWTLGIHLGELAIDVTGNDLGLPVTPVSNKDGKIDYLDAICNLDDYYLNNWSNFSQTGTDHLMLITGHEDYREYVAIALIGTACTWQGVSVCGVRPEVNYPDEMRATLAHEIAHSVGIEHDHLYDAACDHEDFLMYPIALSGPQPTIFSDGSIDALHYFIRKLNRHQKNCMIP